MTEVEVVDPRVGFTFVLDHTHDKMKRNVLQTLVLR